MEWWMAIVLWLIVSPFNAPSFLVEFSFVYIATAVVVGAILAIPSLIRR